MFLFWFIVLQIARIIDQHPSFFQKVLAAYPCLSQNKWPMHVPLCVLLVIRSARWKSFHHAGPAMETTAHLEKTKYIQIPRGVFFFWNSNDVLLWDFWSPHQGSSRNNIIEHITTHFFETNTQPQPSVS
jgi:hypothetical protein